MPFASTRMIPTGWSAHHQPGMVTAFNATITITDPARTIPGVFDPATMTSGPPTVFYVAGETDPVPVRIQRLREENEQSQAGQDVPTRLYLLQAPADLPAIDVGYEVTVVTATNDADLVGETMKITDTQHGSERFTRDFVASHNKQPVRSV